MACPPAHVLMRARLPLTGTTLCNRRCVENARLDNGWRFWYASGDEGGKKGLAARRLGDGCDCCRCGSRECCGLCARALRAWCVQCTCAMHHLRDLVQPHTHESRADRARRVAASRPVGTVVCTGAAGNAVRSERDHLAPDRLRRPL